MNWITENAAHCLLASGVVVFCLWAIYYISQKSLGEFAEVFLPGAVLTVLTLIVGAWVYANVSYVGDGNSLNLGLEAQKSVLQAYVFQPLGEWIK